MEFAGTEKRIQALFSELSLEDQKHTPHFERLWPRAEKSTPAPLFKRAFALTSAVIIIVAASSFALWSTRSESALNITPLELPSPQPVQFAAAVVDSPRPPRAHRRRPTPQRQIITNAELLSRWQSPTESFMQSTSVPVLNSLPQLDQSAKDLESFLPKKESNQ